MSYSKLTSDLNRTTVQSSPFSLINNFLLANLEDNLHEQGIDELETRLLCELNKQAGLRGVIFNCCNLLTTDHHDLKRLSLLIAAIRLMGVDIGIYGVSPGLAVMIVASGVKLDKVEIGADLDDLLVNLQK
jgi:hypothetical protein